MSDRILLIDGMNYLYKAKIVFKSKPSIPPPKVDNWGFENPTLPEPKIPPEQFVIVYNAFRNLRALIEEFNPRKVFFCLEGKNSFRKALYSEYKANRIIKTGSEKSEKELKSREDFNRQVDIILSLLRHLPITQVFSDTFEADDVLFTLSHNLQNEETIIISNDTDLIQILQKDFKGVRLFNHFKKEFVAPPDYHYFTFKTLDGDRSDNIPRCTSAKKALEFSIDPKKLVEFLANEENLANYKLNKQLVELHLIPDDQLQFIDYTVNFNLLKSEFEKMELKTLIANDYWNRFVSTFKSLH